MTLSELQAVSEAIANQAEAKLHDRFAVGSIVEVWRPVGKGCAQFRGLRARVLRVLPRDLGVGDVYHVAFIDPQPCPINDNYFDTEELRQVAL